MVFTLILLVIIALGVMMVKSYNETTEIMGIFTLIFSLIIFIVHIIAWGTTTYNYNSFVERRNAFELTLKSSRESGNEYEAAAIIKEISEWNQDLAVAKYDNKTLLFDCYVDDRFENLEPIK